MRSRIAVILSLSFLALINTSNLSAAAMEKVLYSFGGGSDGAYPLGGLVLDSSGHLFGTTETGGTGSGCFGGCGTVFELTRTQNGWTKTVLHSFSADGNGSLPVASLTLDKSGNLFGITAAGGIETCDCGVVFELSNNGQGWTEQVLHAFGSSTSDGVSPQAGLILDNAGNLFGVTASGGITNTGTIFQLSPTSEGGWTYSVIYTLNGIRDGSAPYGALAMDRSGALYETTFSGGSYGSGTVFRLARKNGVWSATTLYHFTGGDDGGSPYSGVILDETGNLYGMTRLGGFDNVGTVYKLSRASGNWSISTLYSFGGGNDGGYPTPGSLAIDSQGSLYGTTQYGGYLQYGTVFEVHLTPAGWQELVLHSFGSGEDATYPNSGLMFDSLGNLYGTASQGGAHGYGVVYTVKVPPPIKQ